MHDSDLAKLHAAVGFLVGEESFTRTVERLREELARSGETFVWAAVDLESIPRDLPPAIKSCWIFHLRRDTPSGCHYHPNSIQHMVMVSGKGSASIGSERRILRIFEPSVGSLEDMWCVIGLNVPHEFTPERDDMTVVSFHTCDASELEEVECETGGSRLYEGQDA